MPLVVRINAERSPARPPQDFAAPSPRWINGGSSRNGSLPHLALEMAHRAAGVGGRITPVPYRSGGALSHRTRCRQQ